MIKAKDIEGILEAWEEEGKDYITRFSYSGIAQEIRQLFEPKPSWICERCRFRDTDEHCLCPKMYPTLEMSPEVGVFINCSKRFTECKHFEPKPDTKLRERFKVRQQWILAHYGEHNNVEELINESVEQLMQDVALIPDKPTIKALDGLRGKLTELEKKLDDREVDLIEAKRNERERIEGYFDIKTTYCTFVITNSVEECFVIRVKDWRTLKGG